MLFLSALWTLSGHMAHAQEASDEARLVEARLIFERGLALTDQERWAEALEYFRRSRAIAERPSSIYNAAVALYHLGRYQEAVAAFEDYLEVASRDENREQYEEALRYLEEMRQNLGRLTLRVNPPTAVVAVDGAPVPGVGELRELRLDPGSRNITISAEGYRTRRLSLSVLEGQVHERSVVLPVRAETVLGVRADVSAATISIDGIAVGTGSVEMSVEPGGHEVDISAEGYERYAEHIEVEFGEHHRIEAALRPVEPGPTFLSSPWPWIVAAVVVVATAVATAAVLSQQGDPLRDYDGTTGVVIEGLSW